MPVNCGSPSTLLTTWTAFTLWACATAEARHTSETTNDGLANALWAEWIRMSD